MTPWIVACQAPLSFTISCSLSDSCQLSWWCYLSISSSASPFSFCLQSFSASGSFPVSCLFTSDGQSIGASVSASVFPINIQDLFPLRLTSLMSLLSKGLSRAFQHHSSKANWNRMFLTTSWDGGSHRIILDWGGERWHLLHTDVDSNSCITCVKWPNCSHQEYERSVGAIFREQLISTLSTLDVTLRACVRGIQTDCRGSGFGAFLSADSWCSSLSITAIWGRNWCREQYR